MATEKRLIDLDAYEDFKSECLMSTTPGLHSFDAGFEEGMERAAEWLDLQPTVDAVEVVHGHWIEHSHLEVGGECSVCGWQFQWFENDEAHYCPHCGAKMDLEV